MITAARSFVYDFERDVSVNRIELFPDAYTHRVRGRDIRLYYRESEGSEWKEIRNWKFSKNEKNGSLSFTFKEAVNARQIKIHCTWDDRNFLNVSIDSKATFKGNPVNLLRIWMLEESRIEDYEYDGNSSRVKLTENGTEQEYEYYKNKENGNTARVMYDGKWWYTYDENGNRTARSAKASQNGNNVTLDKTGEYWIYTWDLWNRLIKVEQHNAPDNAQNVLVEYTYDVLNHRIQRVSRTKSVVETTQYAYDRNGAITYRKKTSGDSVTTRSFVYLNNQIVGFTDKEGQIEGKFYTVTDIQGSVTEVYGEDGSLVWKSGYTAFGIKAGESTKFLDFDGLYTGCDYDAETGLTYHWNRWRSEDGNSWLSEDPARDGVNWYEYCYSNPNSFIDGSGLLPVGDNAPPVNTSKNVESGKPGNKGKENGTGESPESSETPTLTPDLQPSIPEIQNPMQNVEQNNGNLYAQAVNGLLAMANLDFGADWGNAAAYNFKNGHYFLGFIQEINGMGECLIDFTVVYVGAALAGASISAVGTAYTEKSLTEAYLDFDLKINNSLNRLSNGLYRIYSSINKKTSNSISFPINDAQIKHIFRDAPGHISDTPKNRKQILDVVNNKSNYLGIDKRGNSWYQKINKDGTQTWVRVRDGIIDNAGINQTPRNFDSATGLYNNTGR